MKSIPRILLAAAVLGLATGCAANAAHGPDYPAWEPAPRAYEHGFHNDRGIHDRVHRALRRARGVPAGHIRVHVTNGDVYLRGHVFNWKQRNRAHNIAHSVAGVRRVSVRDLRVGHRRSYW